MAVQLIGGVSGDIPFNRTFFNATLGELVEQSGKDRPVKLTLFLSDGTTLDVCMIQELSDDYIAVRAYQGESDTCELSLQLIPYGLIYRIEISPKSEGSSRVGFEWKSPAKKGSTSRRAK
jgi:hypothetical protein